MIYLRKFTVYDREWLQKNLLRGYSVDKVVQTIDEWDTKRRNGYPFEMYAITDNTKTVGWISIQLLEDLITARLDLEILPKFRRKGYGKFAMRQLLEVLCRHEYWHLSARIAKDNTAGIALHESLGYSLCGEDTEKDGQVFLLYKLETYDWEV